VNRKLRETHMPWIAGLKSKFKDPLAARLIAISVSLLVGAALMAIKFYVYRRTGSSAVLSDALESIINVVASGFAMGSILLAARPPDRSHPYGHGKIEYFSAGFEGALIILAALGIFRVGFGHLFEPRHLPHLDQGLLILFGAGLANLILGLGLIRVGRQTDSLTLIADGKHVMTDVYTSAGVLLGLLLVRVTGYYWIDGTLAILVGINILATGTGLVRHAFSGLMDASDPGLLEKVSTLICRYRRDTWIDVHQLRASRSGSHVHIDLHLILPGDLSLEAAHREAKELEQHLISDFAGNASVLIHMDPCIEPDCAICKRRLCAFRKQNQTADIQWDWKTLIKQGGAGERLNRSRFRDK